MDLLSRRAGTLFAGGLGALLVWGVAVSDAMPSSFDPGEDCELTFHRDHATARTVSWLPPRAVCDFGSGDVRQFIPAGRATGYTIVFALLVALTVLGLVLIVRRPAGGATGPRNLRFGQFSLGTTLVLCVLGAWELVGAIAGVLGGPPGVLVVVVAATSSVAAIATLLDRTYGPSTVAGSRRRGICAGLGATAAGLVLVLLRLPLGWIWAPTAGATTYLLITALQWVIASGQAGTASSSR
ncbi:hypothetical protein AB0P21_40925 [Kribbella sp. NPDC056861]|uniref:hypothetical protein n=1 Tax=Kribbella sp. NPDC056861 TaxID=3154857 RepID=UPI003437A54E